MTKPLLSGIVGFAVGVGVVLLTLAYVAAEPPAAPPPVIVSAPAGPALTVDHLTAKVAPVIQEKLAGAKEDIVAASGGPVARTAVRVAFPAAVREVPTFTEHGIRAVANEFGSYSVSDLIQFLENAVDKQPKAGRFAGADGGKLLDELRALQAKGAQ